MTENDKLLIKWAKDGQAALVRYAGLLRAVWEQREAGDQQTDHVLGPLFNACFSTSDSALRLMQARKLWDAEALTRTVVEGTVRFVFICSPDPAERSKRVAEYTEHLPAIGQLKDHKRVESFLASIPDPDAAEWRPLRDILLSSDELAELEAEYPRKRRQALEQAWSFIPIAEWLEKSGLPGSEGFTMLLHNYGMSSHVIHLDWRGTSIIWERQHRSPERIDWVEVAHAARILVDLLAMALLRVSAAYRYKGLELDPVLDVMKTTEQLIDETRAAGERWRQIEYGEQNITP